MIASVLTLIALLSLKVNALPFYDENNLDWSNNSPERAVQPLKLGNPTNPSAADVFGRFWFARPDPATRLAARQAWMQYFQSIRQNAQDSGRPGCFHWWTTTTTSTTESPAPAPEIEGPPNTTPQTTTPPTTPPPTTTQPTTTPPTTTPPTTTPPIVAPPLSDETTPDETRAPEENQNEENGVEPNPTENENSAPDDENAPQGPDGLRR